MTTPHGGGSMGPPMSKMEQRIIPNTDAEKHAAGMFAAAVAAEDGWADDLGTVLRMLGLMA